MTSRLTGAKRLDLPTLTALLEDLGKPAAGEVAEVLGVDRSTVSGWMRRGAAPRPAMLALFWLSSWGASELDADLYNRSTLRFSIARCVEDENTRLRRELARVLQVADFGTANQPLFSVKTAADLLAEPGRRLTAIAF